MIIGETAAVVRMTPIVTVGIIRKLEFIQCDRG